MKSKYLKIFEALCVAALIVFIALTAGFSGTGDASAEQVSAEVVRAAGLDTLTLRGNEFFRRSFGLNAGSYEGVAYYSSDDIMTVDELLVVRLPEGDGGDTLTEAIEKYARDRFNLYDGYAQAQSELLSNYVLKISGKFVLFAVCEDSHAAQDAFARAVRA